MATASRKKGKTKIDIKMKTFPILPQFGAKFFSGTKRTRKKVNFMVNEDILAAIKFYIPEGERSDFVNETFEEALRDVARKEAVKFMDKFRKEAGLKMTTEEFTRLKNYGRE